MTCAFVAFIDEAGDEGFKILPRPAKKSSEWFIMSAVVVPADKTRMFDNALYEFRSITDDRGQQKKGAFHFRNARHEERIAFLKSLRGWPFKIITVATHKPSIRATTALAGQSHILFQYATKLLVERISWYCRERSDSGPVALIFAERGQLKVKRITSYLEHLEETRRNSNIRWNVINPNMVEVVPCAQLTGLQVADAAVSSVAQALELSRYSTTEHRYVKMWRYRYYRKDGICNGYGLKVFPKWPYEERLIDHRFHWRRHFN